MRMPGSILVVIWCGFVLAGLSTEAKAETSECLTCTDIAPGSPQEVRIEYRDGSARPACGLPCAGAMLAAYRGEDVKTIWVREHESGRVLDAGKAYWVLGSGGGAIYAFSARAAAEAFSAARGGTIAGYKEMMAALFSGMYDRVIKTEPLSGEKGGDDIASHPKCVYCGMDRLKYSHGRVLLKYSDGSEAGLCSVHCAGIDLALHKEKTLSRFMVGTYDRRDLVDAGKAIWVLGGSKQGIMSIRGKWAFEKTGDAEAFIAEFGGSIARLRDVMTAAFEDMWEIIR